MILEASIIHSCKNEVEFIYLNRLVSATKPSEDVVKAQCIKELENEILLLKRDRDDKMDSENKQIEI